MKTQYHIKIKEDSRMDLETALITLGVEYEHKISTGDATGVVRRDYIVSLTKYEFLYIRLAVKTGKVVQLA